MLTSNASVGGCLQDEDTRNFVAHCLSPADQRPTATQLLEEPFIKPEPQQKPPVHPQDSRDLQRSSTDVGPLDKSEEPNSRFVQQLPEDDDAPAECEAGHVSVQWAAAGAQGRRWHG